MRRSMILDGVCGVCLVVTVLGVALSAGAVDLDERPAQPGEWGYRPDGAEVGLNPPGFTWRPVEGAVSYTLEIARDEAVTDTVPYTVELARDEAVVYTRVGVPWSAHCPPTPLPVGALRWRYAAIDGDGRQSAWSRVRTFTIAADAVTFPLPTREQLTARMPKEHPRLFFRPEDVTQLRELASGLLAAQAADVIKQADRLLAAPPDTTEPPKYPKEVTRREKPDEWRKIWWGNRNRVIAVANGAAT